ncbi:MAG: hypothetical protein ABIH23_00590 [bacterium]
MLRVLILAMALMTVRATADDTWKQPLNVKEKRIEEGIERKHNILGLYPSMVEIPVDGGPIDFTTTNPFADIQHAVCWTANYLAGLSYKIAFLKATGAPSEEIEATCQRADEVFEAIYRCQRITGVKGLQARGYFLGHGEVYAERTRSEKLAFWRQGELDGQAFRWVGDPSHHNYSDSIHGLGQYYTLAAEGEQKDRARECIDALVGYWVDNDLKIAKFDRTLPEVPILGLTDGKTLNTRVFMAISGAKVAHYATGKEKYKAVYDRLIEQYGVRGLKKIKTSKDFDDGEHVFSHLDLLFRIEDDPELLAAFRKVADGLWENHRGDAQSLFTYIYYALAPDAPDKEKALNEALRSLQTFPTDMTVKPCMNSLNPDLKPPYPTYLAAWDNEYIWKGNLLRSDGWLSRTVVDVAVSPEDPMVIYAVGQEGGLYQSRDGAASWQNWLPIDQVLHSAVRAVDVGERSRILLVACDDGFYVTTTGGAGWRHMPVPADGGRPTDVMVDPKNPNIVYATTSKGAYRSRDFGEEFLGQSWGSLTEELPPLNDARFLIAPGEPGRVYAVSGNTLFTRKLDAADWTRGTDFGLGEYADTYPWFVVDPSNPDRIVVGVKSKYGGMGGFSILQESMDSGQTWSNDFRAIYEAISKGGFPAVMALGVGSELNHLIADPSNTMNLYAAGERGVMKSADGGKTWNKHQEGFSIPLVHALFKSRHSDWVFASTPGGLYISKDHGETWGDGNLWLQFTKNTRRELGGAAFIDAYWRARYHGFIDDTLANAPYEGTGPD